MIFGFKSRKKTFLTHVEVETFQTTVSENIDIVMDVKLIFKYLNPSCADGFAQAETKQDWNSLVSI